MMNFDIQNKEDVQKLVNTFYDKVKIDDLIGPIFNEKIGDRWGAHLQTMYQFWETILLEESSYSGRPFPPHAQLPISDLHFERWLVLFQQTLDELFEGEVAQEAFWRAEKMAIMFASKINYFRENHQNPIF